MNPEIRKLAAWATSNGWLVEDAAKGYTHFFDPDGTHVGYYPATPGNAYRRRMQLEVHLARAGLELPIPGKKVLRARRAKEFGDGDASGDE